MKISDINSVNDITKLQSNDVPKITVSLPSKGVFYGGRDSIQVSPLTVRQVRQLYSASLIQSPYEKETTIANALADSVHDFDLFKLTYHDYQFLKYWIRLNTYKKSPLILTWSYTDENNNRKDVQSTITNSDLIINELDKHKKCDPKFGYMTVSDYLSLLEIEDEAENLIATLACYYAGNTLEDKIKAIQSLEATEIIPELTAQRDNFAHNVEEYVVLGDPEVPSFESVRVKLTIEAINFFP